MKRLTAFIVLFCTLFAAVSCAPSGEKKKQPSAVTTAAGADDSDTDGTTVYYEPDSLPEKMDFGGQKVTFLSVADTDWFNGEVTVEDLTSEVLNDSIYNRELFVEDRLNVEIEEVKDDEGFESRLFQSANAGDDNYQILCQRTLYMSGFILDGYLCDLYEFEHLDFNKPWWSQKFIGNAELMDRLYIATGSISLSLKRFLFGVFYNKKVAENFEASFPELESDALYGIVESGKWTFDKFYEFGNSIYVDLNGNSEADVEDIYGIGFGEGITVDIIWSSFDLGVFSRNDDGWFDFEIDTEKLDNSVGMISKLLQKTKGCFNPGVADSDLDTLDMKIADDTLLFSVNRIMAIESNTLRNMQSEYGILPTPKYDENQTEYYSYAHDQYTCCAIPVTCVEKECAGAVLEAMASYSYRYTEPAYLDMALKGKYLNDMQSRRIIDMIISGFKVDSSWIYLYTLGVRFSAGLRAVSAGEGNLASFIASNGKKVKATLPLYQQQFISKCDIY